jgi:hypothetical protein
MDRDVVRNIQGHKNTALWGRELHGEKIMNPLVGDSGDGKKGYRIKIQMKTWKWEI